MRYPKLRIQDCHGLGNEFIIEIFYIPQTQKCSDSAFIPIRENLHKTRTFTEELIIESKRDLRLIHSELQKLPEFENSNVAVVDPTCFSMDNEDFFIQFLVRVPETKSKEMKVSKYWIEKIKKIALSKPVQFI